MKDNFKFTDLISLISFIPFFIPEKILTFDKKTFIFLISIILFLFYRIISTIMNNKKIIIKSTNDFNELNKRYIDLNSKHTELAKLFDGRVNTIDNLKDTIHSYNHLMLILEQSLSTAMVTKEENKELIESLIKLVLIYKNSMEVNNNGE